MAVPKLDLQAVWNSGKTWKEWTAASQPAVRETMERYYHETPISDDDAVFLGGIKRPVHILALSEDWCGDVQRNTPVLARVCAVGTQILLRIVDKETRPELMVRYLTNAAEAIPIFVFMSDKFVEVGNWGPRPYECKRLMARGKASGQMDVARAGIHKFYEGDKHRSTVKEIRDLIAIAAAEAV